MRAPIAAVTLAVALALASRTHAAINDNCNTNDDCFDETAQGYCNPTVGTSGFLGKCAACNAACNTCAGPDTDDCTSCAPQSSTPNARGTNRFPVDFTPVPARTTKGTCAPCANTMNPAASNCSDTTCPGFYYTPAPIGGSSTCSVCDATCATCNGPSPTQCTSCPANRFLPMGSTSGSSSCLACANQNTATGCSKANCPAFYFVPAAGQGGLGTCSQCDPSCATCNGPASNQCTACPIPRDTISAREMRTFLSFSGAGAGAGSGTCARCNSASQSACTTANCPGFFYANQDPNSNGICIACSQVPSNNIAFCNAQNCPNFFISQTLGQPNTARQTCYNCTLANTAAECSSGNCPAYFLNTKGTSPTNDDTCDLRSSTQAPTAAPTAAPPTAAPTAATAAPTAAPTAAATAAPTKATTMAPTTGAIPDRCSAVDEYRAPGGCAKCVTSNSPFKQRIGGYTCVDPVTTSDTSTTCTPFELKAYPRKAGTSASVDTCIRQPATDNIVSVLIDISNSNVPFLEPSSYVKSSLRLNGIKPRITSTGQVVFVDKGSRRLIQFDDRFRVIRRDAPKSIFLTGVLRPYEGATVLRCFEAKLRVCA